MSSKSKSIFIGSIFFMIFAALRNLFPIRNMLFFVIACIIFISTTLLSFLLIKKNSSLQISPKLNCGIAIIIPLSIILWMILFYINEMDAGHPLKDYKLIRRYFPFPLWLGLMIAGTVICLFLLSRKQHLPEKIRQRIRFVVTIVFAATTSVQFYAPNIFQDNLGGTYHSHAYTSSIINVCWLTPYSQDLESLYGHYAILYMPLLKAMHKLCHIDYLTGIFIVSACLAGISILLFAYVLNNFARHDVIYYLALLGIGEYYFMLMRDGVYIQVHPHRMIFPILLAALAIYECRTGKKRAVISIIILSLSFVWSSEIGLVTLLAFSLYRFADTAMDGQPFHLKKFLVLLKNLLIYALLPFGIAWLIINGYNLIAGGRILEFSEFMFPLISDRDYIDGIEMPLPDITHPWTAAAIIFLIFVSLYLIPFLFSKEKDKKYPLFFFFGITGLGLMLYYINRAVEGGMFITMYFMLTLQAIILQKSQDIYMEWKSDKKPLLKTPKHLFFLSLRIITVFILFVLAFDCVYSMPKAWKTSYDTIWKRNELKEFADYIYVQVPPDAVSFGEGVPELLSMVDRDTHLHTTEWSYLNMPLDTMERIRHELEGSQWLFCSLSSLNYLQENYPGLTDNYELHEQFEYNGAEFGFFVKLDE